jgi:hypothetical protein
MERSSKGIKEKRILRNPAAGSHIIVENGRGLWTAIPRKNELGKGLLLEIIAECDITKKEFLELL